MSYDEAIGVFTPDGRLIQVEYAQNASERGSLITFAAIEAICISFEIKPSPMTVQGTKLHVVDKELNFYISFSGLISDASLILNQAIAICRNYFLANDEHISLSILAGELGRYKQYFTITGGKRPFGVKSILFGYEDGVGKAVVINPDGNCSEYAKGAVGNKADKALEIIEKENGSAFEQAVSTMVKVVSIDKNKIETYLLTKEGLSTVAAEYIQRVVDLCKES